MKHIPYELALLARQKGYNELCSFQYFHHDKFKIAHPIIDENQLQSFQNSCLPDYALSAPLFEEIVDWFRDECPIRIRVTEELGKGTFGMYCFSVRSQHPTKLAEGKTYYEALIKALEEAFKLI